MRIDDAQLERALVAHRAGEQVSPCSSFATRWSGDGVDFNQFREEIRNEILLAAPARARGRQQDRGERQRDRQLPRARAKRSSARDDEYNLSHPRAGARAGESGADAETRARAEEALAQLRAGADFAQVSATFSDAPDALQGGSLGWRAPARLPSDFRRGAAVDESGRPESRAAQPEWLSHREARRSPRRRGTGHGSADPRPAHPGQDERARVGARGPRSTAQAQGAHRQRRRFRRAGASALRGRQRIARRRPGLALARRHGARFRAGDERSADRRGQRADPDARSAGT